MNDTLNSNFDEPVHFKKGQVIFAQGESSAFLYIVVSGKIQIFDEQNGKLTPISTVGQQDFIGELSMFNDEPRSATAIALTSSTLMMIKKSDIRRILKTCPDWVSNILVTISDRLRSTVDVLKEHRILDDVVSNDALDRGSSELKEYEKNLEQYRKRRG